LFNDTTTTTGDTFYYRVKAKNESGISDPSNVVGPVSVEHLSLIDEMKDYSFILSQDGNLSLENKEARKFKEDLHRLKGEKASSITYKTPGWIQSGTILAFFPGKMFDFQIWGSKDGGSYSKIPFTKQSYFTGQGDYAYAKPVEYTFKNLAEYRFLKIQFNTDAQISRIKINWTK
jgi:hypothetical protein